MNQELLHQVRCQPQERSLFIRSTRSGRTQRFDFDQLKVKLMNDRGGLERVIDALGSHTCCRDPPELRIEKIDQATGRLMVAPAKTRHQLGHRLGLNRG